MRHDELVGCSVRKMKKGKTDVNDECSVVVIVLDKTGNYSYNQRPSIMGFVLGISSTSRSLLVISIPAGCHLIRYSLEVGGIPK
jgi:hypothetical protein